MAKYDVTPWEFLDNETNSKFQFRQNTSDGKLLDTYTIRFESVNTTKNGKSLGTVHKNFFDETRATLHSIWECTNSEDEFTNIATSIFQKKRRFTTMRVPMGLVPEFEVRIEDYLDGGN